MYGTQTQSTRDDANLTFTATESEKEVRGGQEDARFGNMAFARTVARIPQYRSFRMRHFGFEVSAVQNPVA